MRYCLVFFLFGWFILQPSFIQAQKKMHYWDSLEREIRHARPDTLTVIQLNELFDHYANNGEKEAMPFAARALELSDSLGFFAGQTLSNLNVGMAHDMQGNYYLALRHYHKALKLAREHGFDKYRGSCLLSLGYFYGTQENYDKAIAYTKEAAALDSALYGLLPAAYCWSNMAYYYLKKQQYDSSLFYTLKSHEIFKAEKDSLGLGDVYFNLGNIAWEEEGNAFKALNYCLKAHRVYKGSTYTDVETLSECQAQIGFLYIQLQNFEKAAQYLNKAMGLAEKNKLRHLVQVCYQHKALMFARAGDFRKAYEHHQMFYELYDSLHDRQSLANMKQLQADFELEAQQAKIALLNKDQIIKQDELNRQLFIRNGFIGMVAMLLVLAAVLYRNNEQKQKSNQLLLKQKEEIEKKSRAIVGKNQMLQEQKRAMLFQSRNLHDANQQISHQKKTIEKKNSDITASLNYARSIQYAMLPRLDQIKAALADSFIWLQPRDIVSGDFYWFDQQGDLLFLAAVDCTGHGVPGAFMSLIGDSYLSQIVKIEKEYEPDRILASLSRHVNEVLKKETTDNQDGMEMSMCVIDQGKKELRFAGARNHLLYVQDGELHKLRGNRAHIGGISKEVFTDFETQTVSFEKSACFYVYTDGIKDQFGGPRDKKFGEKQLKELILKIHQLPMETQDRLIKERLREWMVGYEQVDDILLMGWRLP